MTDQAPKSSADDKPLDGDKIVDQAIGAAAEKLGELNPELALQSGRPRQNQIKMAVDYGPLIAFGVTFFLLKMLKLSPDKPLIFFNFIKFEAGKELIWASGVLGAASLIALIAGLAAEKRIAWIPLMSCVITIPFSILTVIFQDDTFVKIKMTIVDVLIAGILLGGLALKKQPLKVLLGEAIKLKDTAWPKLTVYYALFYLVMALINEIIWRTQSNEFWLSWKLISIIGGPVVFSLALLPFMMKNMIVDPDTETKK
ncbi:MAG: septation protein IspZ [Asticcacaulis sp.]